MTYVSPLQMPYIKMKPRYNVRFGLDELQINRITRTKKSLVKLEYSLSGESGNPVRIKPADSYCIVSDGTTGNPGVAHFFTEGDKFSLKYKAKTGKPVHFKVEKKNETYYLVGPSKHELD